MPIENLVRSQTYPAAADLTAKQYYAVNGDKVAGVNVATAAKNITGILQNKPNTGQAAEVAVDGITRAAITASTGVTAGQLLEVDTGGTLKVIAAGTAVARAEETLTSFAGVCIISVRMLPNNAVYA